MRFTSMTRANSSGVVSSKVAKSPTAARCTHVSSLPYSSTARSATALTCSKSEVSATTAVASPPSCLISSTSEVSPSSPRAETTTFAPRLANRRADSRPMPLEAPISATTCSSTGFSCILTTPLRSTVPQTYQPHLCQKGTSIRARQAGASHERSMRNPLPPLGPPLRYLSLSMDKLLYGRVEVAFALVEGPVSDPIDEPQRSGGDAPRRVLLEGGGEQPVLRAASDEGASLDRFKPVV